MKGYNICEEIYMPSLTNITADLKLTELPERYCLEGVNHQGKNSTFFLNKRPYSDVASQVEFHGENKIDISPEKIPNVKELYSIFRAVYLAHSQPHSEIQQRTLAERIRQLLRKESTTRHFPLLTSTAVLYLNPKEEIIHDYCYDSEERHSVNFCGPAENLNSKAVSTEILEKLLGTKDKMEAEAVFEYITGTKSRLSRGRHLSKIAEQYRPRPVLIGENIYGFGLGSGRGIPLGIMITRVGEIIF